MTSAISPTARDIISDVYTASDRDDIDYTISDDVDWGGEYRSEADVILTVGSESMVIAAQFDRETGDQVGYTWSTYATPQPSYNSFISTDGTDSADAARAAVEAFVAQVPASNEGAAE